ncbi:MAG: hypothetical protein LBV20_05650 [Treponema sp.]|jgi:hypothetical protein|nr:hypothetical protein [Treponema sp.]
MKNKHSVCGIILMVMLIGLLVMGCEFFVLNGDGTNTDPSENTQDDETDIDNGTGVDPSENTVAGFKETGRLLYNEIKASMAEEEKKAASFMFNSSEYINLRDYDVIPNDDSVEVQKNNNASFIEALEEVIATGKTLYIPDGKYYMFNEDSAIVNLIGNIAIRGQSRGKTVLIDPPRLDMSGDVYLEHISVMSPRHEYYNNGEEYTVAFLYLMPAGMQKLFINNVFFSGNHGNSLVRTNATYHYGQGYSSAIVTNCEITNAAQGIVLNCEIGDGSIENKFEKNIMQEFGEKGQERVIRGIVLGSYESGNYNTEPFFPAKILAIAQNTIIQKNYFKNWYNDTSTATNWGNPMQGILVYGQKTTVQNNYLENLLGGPEHYAIYTKTDREGKIVNNTMYNAGDARAITQKAISPTPADNTIQGNRIISDTGFRGTSTVPRLGIHIENPKFLVADNFIRFTGIEGAVQGLSVQGITTDETRDYPGDVKHSIQNGVITGNDISVTGLDNIKITHIVGEVAIENNTLNYKPGYGELNSRGGAISLQGASDNINPMNIKITNNTISASGTKAEGQIYPIGIARISSSSDVAFDGNTVTFDNSGREEREELEQTIHFNNGTDESVTVSIKNNIFTLINAQLLHRSYSPSKSEQENNTML